MLRRILSLLSASLIIFWGLFLVSCTKSVSLSGSLELIDAEELEMLRPLQGRGPYGEEPAGLDSLLELMDGVKPETVRSKGYRVAIAMHDVKNDWAETLLKGIEDTLGYYDISTLVITDGGFDMDKQIADYNNIFKLKPDLLITLPIDSERAAPVLRKFIDEGIKLVFIDTIPSGYRAPADYVSFAVGDSYVMGKLGAELLIERLRGEGSVALLHWSSSMFTVDQRSRGAREAFLKSPGITIVAEEYFTDFYEVAALTEKIIEHNSDLAGLWAVWDTPAFEAIEVIRSHGLKTLVTTVDLSREAAKMIANDDILLGTATDHPYEQGVAVSLSSAAALEGLSIPSYIVINAEMVTGDNLSSAWRRVYKGKLFFEESN